MKPTNIAHPCTSALIPTVLLLQLCTHTASAADPSTLNESARTRGCSHLRYTATPITASDGTTLYARGFNNKGQVVGQAYSPTDGSNHAFLWENGHYFPLQERILSGGWYSIAFAINDRSQITGEFLDFDFNQPTFLLDRYGLTVLNDVGFFGGGDINNLGQITGAVQPGSGYNVAAVYHDGEVITLPLIPGYVSSTPSAINERGVLAGLASPVDGNSVPVIWKPPYAEATALPLPANAVSSASVPDLNDRNEVLINVNVLMGAEDFGRGYIWRAGSLTTLNPFPGYENSAAVDIDNTGLVIVSSYHTDASGAVTTLWRDGEVCALNDLVEASPVLAGGWIGASHINDRGEMLATNINVPGAVSYLLKPKR